MNLRDVMSYMKSNPDDTDGIALKMAELADSCGPIEVRNLFVDLNKIGMNGFETAILAFYKFAELGRCDLIDLICAGANAKSFLYGAYCVGSAYCDFRRYEVESGAAHLRNGLFYHAMHRSSFPGADDAVGFLRQNSFLLEAIDWPGPARYAAPSFETAWRSRFDSTPYTIFCLGDPKYIRHYAGNFIGSLRERCGDVDIFVMTVNPDEDSLAFLKELDGRHGGISAATTAYSGEWLAEFCISSRFIMANEILAEIGGPTIFMDIDASFPPNASELLAAISRYPLSYSDTKSVAPSLIVDASIIGAHPCEDATAFFDMAADFMLYDLSREGPLWMLDQMALYRAVCAGRKNGWDITEMNSALGDAATFPNIFKMNKETIPLGARKAIRSNAAFIFTGITDDRRLVYRRIVDEQQG